MTRDEILQRVQGIVMDRLNVKKDKITLDASFLDDQRRFA